MSAENFCLTVDLARADIRSATRDKGQRAQRGAVEKWTDRRVSTPVETRVGLHDDRLGATDERGEPDDHDPRRTDGERLLHPVVVAIDVDAQ